MKGEDEEEGVRGYGCAICQWEFNCCNDCYEHITVRL